MKKLLFLSIIFASLATFASTNPDNCLEENFKSECNDAQLDPTGILTLDSVNGNEYTYTLTGDPISERLLIYVNGKYTKIQVFVNDTFTVQINSNAPHIGIYYRDGSQFPKLYASY